MKSFARNILTAGIALIAGIAASSQGQSGPSDLSISAISLTAAGPLKKVPVVSNSTNPTNHPVTITASDDILKCTIIVHNDGGYTRLTTLVVVLPVDVTIVSNPFPAIVNKTGDQNRWGMPGCLVFDLFVMSSGLDKTVEFSFTKSTHGNKVGAYVYSACPDPEPANNFKNASH